MGDKKQEKDVFESYEEVSTNAIDEFARLQAQYVQSFTNLQQEANETCRKVSGSAISVAKQLADATQSTRFFVPTLKIASDTTDAFLKTANVNNKVVTAAFDASRQNIRIFNDNVEAFTRLNLDLIKTWQSFAPFRA
ncbi:MAG: hypothetical protein ACE5JV_02120 [Nitrososphaerales archaeon]